MCVWNLKRVASPSVLCLGRNLAEPAIEVTVELILDEEAVTLLFRANGSIPLQMLPSHPRVKIVKPLLKLDVVEFKILTVNHEFIETFSHHARL